VPLSNKTYLTTGPLAFVVIGSVQCSRKVELTICLVPKVVPSAPKENYNQIRHNLRLMGIFAFDFECVP
jgi:hypothetical protein